MASEKLISLRFHQAQQAWRDGHRCLALADEMGAMTAFQAAIRFEPDYWQAYVDLGRIYQQQGALETALTILARSVERTEAPEAHLAYARACCEATQYRRATHHYEQAARQLGDAEPEIYFDWAMAALGLDDVHQVMSCLARYCRLRPKDARGRALADEVPRLLEYRPEDRDTPKAQAYIKDRAILLGTADDDGLVIPQRPAASLSYRDLAAVTRRFIEHARGLHWDWDGFVVGSRSVRPWVQALSVLTGRPIIGRDQVGPDQRLLLVELNWCEAAAIRLADLQPRSGGVWGMALGIKFGARATAITGLLAMVSVPWFRTGSLPDRGGRMEPGPYLEANEMASVPAILQALRDLPDDDGDAQVRYYGADHRQTAVRALSTSLTQPRERTESRLPV